MQALQCRKGELVARLTSADWDWTERVGDWKGLAPLASFIGSEGPHLLFYYPKKNFPSSTLRVPPILPFIFSSHQEINPQSFLFANIYARFCLNFCSNEEYLPTLISVFPSKKDSNDSKDAFVHPPHCSLCRHGSRSSGKIFSTSWTFHWSLFTRTNLHSTWTRKTKLSPKTCRLTVDLFSPLDQLPRCRHQPAGTHHHSASASDHSGNIAASTRHYSTGSCHRCSFYSSRR